MKVHIIGLGLIGGSFAKSIRAGFTEAVISGEDASNTNLEKAQELGLIDHPRNREEMSGIDVVIIAVPVDHAAEVVVKVLDRVETSCLVFDTGSTKSGICAAVREHPNRKNFLAVHPIAGTEFSGPEAAVQNLFCGRTNILCEVQQTGIPQQALAREIFRKLRMNTRYMDPEAHDRHIAYVSHLSHISAFMLGKTVLEKERNEKDIFDLAGSGFASTVRLAKSSPAMWTPIFRQNKEHVLESLNGYIKNLEHFRELLEQDDFETLFNQMKHTNHIKSILKGIE